MTQAATTRTPAFATKINLVRPVLPTFEEMEEGLRSILASGMVTKGRYLQQFEEAVAAHLQVKHAVAVSSCTTGLMLTYQGLGLSGDVVVPSFTFMASVSSLVWAGLRPVFADVDYDACTVDTASVERSITPSTSAIVAVHNFGNPARIRELEEIARRHDVKLVFDAAHGFGARYGGVPVGPQGDAQVFSLSPTKLLIAGEGGIVATNDDDLAEKIRVGREYGNAGNYDSAFAGMNARLAEVNALMGLHSLQKLEAAAERRNAVVDLYRQELGTIPGIGFQRVEPGDRCSYKDFSITVDAEEYGISRDALAAVLAENNIDSRTYYDPPVHRHTAYRRFAEGAELPETDRLAAHCLSIPVWSRMEDEIVLGICEVMRKARQSARS